MEKEVSRIEQFRQFRNEVRGSQRWLIVGIDVAKEKHHAFMGTSTGRLDENDISAAKLV